MTGIWHRAAMATAWCVATGALGVACSDRAVVGREKQTCVTCHDKAVACATPAPIVGAPEPAPPDLGGGGAAAETTAASAGGSAPDDGSGCLPLCPGSQQAWAGFDACACEACAVACGDCPATPARARTFACSACRAAARDDQCVGAWQLCAVN